MPLLEIKDIHKIYQEKTLPAHVLKGICLSIEKGEFTALVGPSGGGKTTLFNLIAGLDQPTKGKIFINQTEITALNPTQKTRFRRDNIGFVFQNNNLIPVLTVEENIALIMQLQKKPSKLIRERINLLVEKLFLNEHLKKLPKQLSGGQQQRVAVARALAAQPLLVLADEPTANLDLKNAENLLELMQKLNQEEGTTFVFSTHDARVMHHARRIIEIEDGVLMPPL